MDHQVAGVISPLAKLAFGHFAFIAWLAVVCAQIYQRQQLQSKQLLQRREGKGRSTIREESPMGTEGERNDANQQ